MALVLFVFMNIIPIHYRYWSMQKIGNAQKFKSDSEQKLMSCEFKRNKRRVKIDKRRISLILKGN